MAHWVRLPKLGANVVEAMVGAWRVADGAHVRVGDPLVEVITSKATFDVESPVEGVLLSILAPEKSAAPIGFVLAVMGDAGEATPPEAAAENARLLSEFGASSDHGDGALRRAEIKATPGARRLAKAESVDLGDVPPGESGVIREDDVRRFLHFRTGR